VCGSIKLNLPSEGECARASARVYFARGWVYVLCRVLCLIVFVFLYICKNTRLV